MIEQLQQAFDTTFFLRLCFGVVAYWFVGIFTKGVFEPLQSHIGRMLFARLNKRLETLQHYANQTCTKIDDVIISSIANNSSLLNGIVNRDDLASSEQQLYRQLLAKTYQLPVLLKKLGLEDV